MITLLDERSNALPLSWLPDIIRLLEQILTEEGQPGADLSLLLCENSFIQELNREYRHKDYATDVLSFPAWEEDDDLDSGLVQELGLGDIILSIEKAAQQAEEFGVTLEEETLRLAVHGCLHLLGYDHETSAQDEQQMLDKQDHWMARYFAK